MRIFIFVGDRRAYTQLYFSNKPLPAGRNTYRPTAVPFSHLTVNMRLSSTLCALCVRQK